MPRAYCASRNAARIASSRGERCKRGSKHPPRSGVPAGVEVRETEEVVELGVARLLRESALERRDVAGGFASADSAMSGSTARGSRRRAQRRSLAPACARRRAYARSTKPCREPRRRERDKRRDDCSDAGGYGNSRGGGCALGRSTPRCRRSRTRGVRQPESSTPSRHPYAPRSRRRCRARPSARRESPSAPTDGHERNARPRPTMRSSPGTPVSLSASSSSEWERCRRFVALAVTEVRRRPSRSAPIPATGCFSNSLSATRQKS